MDIDFFNSSYNEINSYDSEEEEEYNELEESSDEEDFNVRLSYFAGRQKAEIVISDSLPRQVQVTSAAE